MSALIHSLDRIPTEPGLTRAPIADDLRSLESAARDPEVKSLAIGKNNVERLWEVCQVPDYRKVSPQAHADLVNTLYTYLMQRGRVPDDWFKRQIAEIDRTDGDIDTLSARIAQVRTWTFVANRNDWLRDPLHWQEVTRQVEDSLSDALHERLAQRFVDRRTSVLMRRLRENAMLEAEITATGDVLVEAHPVGRLIGFQFIPESDNGSTEGKALRAAALKALASEFSNRATRVSNAVDDAFALSNDGSLRFLGEPIAKLSAGEKILDPRLRILADEHLEAPSRELVQTRIDLWIKAHIEKLLGPLLKLETAEALTGIARGIAFQTAEALGVLDRTRVADDLKTLDQDQRAALRSLGVRFGAYHLTVPTLLKPAPRGLACQLWALKEGGADITGLDDILHLAASGRTSIPVNEETPKALYRAAGFRVCGTRAVRVDILERLADLIRPAIQYRPGVTVGEPPAGAADGDAFVATIAMTSLCGCAGEDFASILKSLGYVLERRVGPAITKELAKPASMEPISAPVSEAADSQADSEPVAPTEPDLVIEAAPVELAPIVEIASEVTEAAEPVMIDVWRQHRQRPHAPRHQRNKPQGQRPAVPSDVPADASSEATKNERPKQDRPRHERDKRSSDDQKRDQRAPRAEGSEERRGPRPPRRDDKRNDRRPQENRGWQDPPKARADNKAPDPDSPFAKLLALKAEMESKGKKG